MKEADLHKLIADGLRAQLPEDQKSKCDEVVEKLKACVPVLWDKKQHTDDNAYQIAAVLMFTALVTEALED